jgi:CRP-like cAMP-binding protein
MVGTSRETVTRVVKGLKEQGWLKQEGKKYLVPAADEA